MLIQLCRVWSYINPEKMLKSTLWELIQHYSFCCVAYAGFVYTASQIGKHTHALFHTLN